MTAAAGVRRLLVALAVTPWLAAPAVATDAPPADPPTPHVPVERIEVRADALETGAALDPTAFATVIHAQDFADRVTSVEELLRDAVGVQVRSLGSEFATISIRGSSAEQVVVYLDGVPLNRALGGGVNLADLPLAQVESIEIYRGFTPASLPAASIGGAVVIHTRRPETATSGTASLAAGSYASAEATWSLSGSGDRAAWAVGLDTATSRGDFVFFDNNGTPTEARDDGLARRRNNDFRRGHLTGRFSCRSALGARFSVATDLFARRQGVPGLDALQSETARFKTQRFLVRPDFEMPGLLGGRLLLRGALDYTRLDESFDDADGDFGTARTTDHRIAALGQEVGFTLIASTHQAVSFLASHRHETADLRNLEPDPVDLGTASRDTLTFTLEDQIELAGDRLVLNPSLRHERYDSGFPAGAAAGFIPGTPRTDRAETTGKAGFRLRLSGDFTLQGNFGRFLRLPSFTELFGDRGSVLGNPALLPERGRSLDLGLIAAHRGTGSLLRQARIEMTLFETLADNLILVVPTAQTTVVALNSGRARVRGAELSLVLALGARFTASLNATHQRAVDTSGGYADGRLLPGRPVDEATAGASLVLGRGRVFYSFTYVGANFVDRENTESRALPARYLHDAGYRLRLSHGLTALIEVKNLTDRRTTDVARFPLPGRSVHGRLAWEF